MGTYKYFLNQEVIEGKRLIEEAIACDNFIVTYIHGVILHWKHRLLKGYPPNS